jgi:hypothetical protein
MKVKRAMTETSVNQRTQSAPSQPDGQQAEPDVINRRLEIALDVRRVFDDPFGHRHRQNPHRHVDVENPAPGIAVRDPAADHRSQNGCHDDTLRKRCHRHAAFLRREAFQHDGLGDRHHRAAADALKNPRQHQRRQVPSQSAQHGSEREHRDAREQHPFAAKIIAEPAGHR